MEFSIEQLLQIIIIDASDLIDVADEVRNSILNENKKITAEDIDYLKDRLQICLSNLDIIDHMNAEDGQ